MIEGLREVLFSNIDNLVDNDIAEYFKSSLSLSIETMTCSECGDTLEYNVNVDEFLDMHIAIEPCRCILEE